MRRLNNNQKAFCREYVKNGNNGTKAYMKAYKNCTKETARRNASVLLTNTDILEYIKELQDKLEDKSIMSAKERMIFLTGVIKGEVKENNELEAEVNDKMKAVDILNKMSGEYTTKFEGNVTQDIIIDIED